MESKIKKILAKEHSIKYYLPINHRKRFEERLQTELHQKIKNKYGFIKIAASLLLLVSLGLLINSKYNNVPSKIKQNYTLGNLSPELEKIEKYYSNAIAYELSQLEVTEESKPVLDKYFIRLAELAELYKKESAQLDIDNISEKSINALIDNLQLRLQLLLKLKEQLQIIKTKHHENKTL